MDLPRIIGHRGAKENAPENTLASFRQAKAEGADWVELDVVLTKDKVPVVLHDETVDRTTNGSGRIDQMTAAEAQALDAGDGERIPTLRDTLKLLDQLDMKVNVELKPADPFRPGRAAETTRETLKVMEQEGFRDPNRALLSSFYPDALAEAKRVAPEMPRGLLLEENAPKQWPQVAKDLAVTTVNFNAKDVTPELVRQAKDGGHGVMAYTVNDPRQAKVLLTAGVDSIFTDAPQRVGAAIDRSRPIGRAIQQHLEASRAR